MVDWNHSPSGSPEDAKGQGITTRCKTRPKREAQEAMLHPLK